MIVTPAGDKLARAFYSKILLYRSMIVKWLITAQGKCEYCQISKDFKRQTEGIMLDEK